MRRSILHAICLSALGLAAACSTPRGTTEKAGQSALESGEPVDWNVAPPPKNVTGHPLRVKLVDFAQGFVFELVNESHTNPHEFYSRKVPNSQAYTKVQSDSVVKALYVRLEELGALTHAQRGLAPSCPPGTRAKAFEIEDEGGPRHWLVYDKNPAQERETFMQCTKDFLELYNATIQMQAVEEAPEWRGASQGRPSGTPVKKGSSSGKVQ